MNVALNKQKTPWSLLGLVILVAVIAGVIVWQLNQHKPSTEQAVAPPPKAEPIVVEESPQIESPPNNLSIAKEPALAQTTAEMAEVIEEPEVEPSPPTDQVNLDTSDASVEAYLAQSATAQLGQLLVPEHKIRKLVRAVNALEEGKLVAQYRPTLPPATPFKAERLDSERWQLSEANFTRYEPYIAALEQAGAEQMLALYQHYSPLLEQAYQELGVDKGSFEQVAKGALKQIINAPEIDGSVALASTSVVYRYQDKALEQLPELHKLLIRIGPDNRERVQNLARELLQEMEQ